ncbi:MAG: DUF4333 domain-containing protein [Mycobacteriaceae bacterium]
MSGPYGPQDPNQQWGQQPGQGQPGQANQPQWGQQPHQGQPWGQQPPQVQPTQQWPSNPQAVQPDAYSQPATSQYPAYGQQNTPTQQNQYGQPQYGQPQFGHPQQGQSAGNQYGANPFVQSRKSGGSQKGLLIGLVSGGVALLAILLFTAFVAPGFALSKKLSQDAAESGVQTVLTDSYGAKDVSDVKCPSDIKVESGSSFTCEVSVEGTKREVSVTFTDNKGTFEVGRPN